MALQEMTLNINFSQGLDTKTDPFQVSIGKFLTLENSVFDKGGRLTKRNGFASLPALPNSNATFLTTYGGNLVAIGTELDIYSPTLQTWLNKGSLDPASLNTINICSNLNAQVPIDMAVSSNGLTCCIFAVAASINTGDVTQPIVDGYLSYYTITDVNTGEIIVPPTPLNTQIQRVVVFNGYFVFFGTQSFVISSTATGLFQYATLNVSTPTASVSSFTTIGSFISYHATISPQVVATCRGFDIGVANSKIYMGWISGSPGTGTSNTINVNTLDTSFVLGTAVTFSVSGLPGSSNIDLAIDNFAPLNPIIWVTYVFANNPSGFAGTLAVSDTLSTILAATTLVTNSAIGAITSTANNGILTAYYELVNYIPATRTYIGQNIAQVATPTIYSITCTQSGTVGLSNEVIRSLGLASKAFVYNGTTYLLGLYSYLNYAVGTGAGFVGPLYQPTYFLINVAGQVISSLAYSNANIYYYNGVLPSVSTLNSTIYLPYLRAEAVDQNYSNNALGYLQPSPYNFSFGVASYSLNNNTLVSAEIGNTLNISGGYLGQFDGTVINENNFFLWPEAISATFSTSSSGVSAQTYAYITTYEWTDNQGNIIRSAPSIAVTATATATGLFTLTINTLRLTAKSNVVIGLYRWSQAQQVYYQVTTINNDPTVDKITYSDGFTDADILGSTILYTNGGTLENIAPPATNIIALFDNRLWLVDAENPNLLWFSKQVIQNVPIEMSDLLTIYIPPLTSVEQSSGQITALFPMDDKLIIFKKASLGYINGTGPDNTGANNGYSNFTLINAVVGCINPNSIVLMPQGLMFQSEKGIWLLGRDLATSYIGAPVENLTIGHTVSSAVNIPLENQVRFTMSSGTTLMYDYYYNQWGTFSNVPAVSSTIYNNYHTYVDSSGNVLQESPGQYFDGSTSNPVLMSFTTGWINFAGLQGYERFKYALLLGQYVAPFYLNASLAYNYDPTVIQTTKITPAQTPTSTSSGGWEDTGNVFEARLFPVRQKCESFQLTLQEQFDTTYGTSYGAGGLTLSGMNLILGMIRNSRTNRANRNFG